MNGGVLHSLKCCSPEELEAVQQAYGYFGLGAIAALLGAAQKSPGESESDDSLEEELDEAYSSVVPDDETLVDAFEKHYRSHPDEFAPVAKIDQM